MKRLLSLSLLVALLASLTAFAGDGGSVAVPERPAQEKPLIRVDGIEEGATYFEPVTPEVVVSADYPVVEMTLNDKPYDGSKITEQGLHTLLVTVSDGEGREFSAAIRFLVLDAGKPSPTYAVDMIRYYVERLGEHPHVTPTASADPRLVLGKSSGWPKDPEVPPHELYGFQVTDPGAEGLKLQVVLVGGNHPGEQTGNWTLQGSLDFLLSDDPRAEDLRRWAIFFVYPMVNPDGRYLVSGRSNPEMRAEKVTDHNRVWNTSGRFSTIDVFVKAILADTGGRSDYLLDFHSAGNSFFFTSADMMRTAYAQAMMAREPEIKPRLSEGHPGMMRNWARSEEGLGVPFTYTPETAGSTSAKRSMEIGRSYMLTFHELITGSSALTAAKQILEQKSEAAFGEKYLTRIPSLKEKLEQALASGDAPVDRRLAAVYELYGGIHDYRESIDLADKARTLMASASRLLERSPLTFAAWIHESLPQRIDELAKALADPDAAKDEVQTRNETLAGLIDGFCRAESAEASASAAAEGFAEAHEGFAAPCQNHVRRRRDRLVQRLGKSGAKAEEIRQLTGALEEAIASYWRIQAESVDASGGFPQVRPVQVARVPEVLELCGRSGWEDGLLVNVEAVEDGLVLADLSMLRFDGDGDYVETGFHPAESNLGQQFTWEFWKKYRVFADATGSSGCGGSSPRFYTQLAGSKGELRTAIGDSYWTSTTLKEEGRWYHIAIVFDKGEVRTYVDGELRNSRSGVKFSGESASPFTIGRGIAPGRWLDGYSREHRIWNTARSQSEIRRYRYRKFEGNEEGLVGYWRLDDGEKETVRDRAALGNHGTVKGASWQERGLPGYRISQPIALAEGIQVDSVVLNWETGDEKGKGDGCVTVFSGFSDAESMLPHEWHKATNGDSLAPRENGGKLPGSYLWVKQELSPRKSEAPVLLRRLTVSVN